MCTLHKYILSASTCRLIGALMHNKNVYIYSTTTHYYATIYPPYIKRQVYTDFTLHFKHPSCRVYYEVPTVSSKSVILQTF